MQLYSDSENPETTKVEAVAPNAEKFHFIPSLDNIRGFAVLFVLLIHVSYGILKGGWVGVDLFFVLSGYLITSLIQIEYHNFGKISIGRFYIRRVLRLFPPLIICVILANVFWSYNMSIYPYGNQLLATIASLFYFINLLRQKFSGSLVHLWSLSVEEHFYLFWPVITSFFLFKLSWRNQIISLVTLILFTSIYRICQYNFNFQFKNSFIIIDASRFTFCSIDGILIGALMAIVLSKPKFANLKLSNKMSTWFIVVLIFIFIIMLLKLHKGFIYMNGGFILLDLLCASAIFVAIKNPTHYLLSNKIIRWMGTRSYGIYVYHYVIFETFENFRLHNSVSNFIIISILRLGVSFLFAEISFRYIEKPIFKIKKRLEPVKVI